MALIVRNIALALDDPEDALLSRVASRLKVPRDAIARHAVVRRSLDARRGHEPRFVFSVELALEGGPRFEQSRVKLLHGRNVGMIEVPSGAPLTKGQTPLPERPVIVGFGPAGMFAALRLVEYGFRPLVLERGRDVRRRHQDVLRTFYREGHFNPESNLLYGEGGAGTYSDGKVYTRVGDPAVREVLAVFVRFGADPDILVNAKPHIGSDRLPTICRRIREHLERAGAEVRFETRCDDLDIRDGRVRGLRAGEERVPAEVVLLGIGHSARDTYRLLHERGVKIEAKPFQFGVRIEHPQALVDRWQYGPAAGNLHLPPADYRLVAKNAAGSGCDLFSFCMCPGGTILPTNESAGLIVTNGASRSARGGPFANSGFVVTVDPKEISDDPLAGLTFQQRWERLAFQATGGTYRVPAQRCHDFLANRKSDGSLETSYPLGGAWRMIADLLPEGVRAALRTGLVMLERKLPGFAGAEGIITAPESRASAPVRITRDPRTRASVTVAGLHPIGEGAGYAGGIVSAALDGRRSAETIIAQYQPPN